MGSPRIKDRQGLKPVIIRRTNYEVVEPPKVEPTAEAFDIARALLGQPSRRQLGASGT